MVQLKAKGKNKYVDAAAPTSLAEAEATVVLASLRSAVDAVLASAGEGPTKSGLNQVIALREVLGRLSTEVEELGLIVQVVEKRMMEL